MLKNYLKIALRNFWKEKGYSLINILGLAIGITTSMFILLFIKDELSYDAFHEKGDRIYRITESFKNGEGYTRTASSPYMIAPLVAERSAGVEAFTRVAWGPDRYVVKLENEKFEETGFNFVDANFFETFSVPLVEGKASQVLAKPNSLVISEEKAKQYFGDTNPIGKSVIVTEGFDGIEMEAEVTGVMKAMPHNMHFHYDLLMPMAAAEDSIMNGMQQAWGWTSQYSYLVLQDDFAPERLKPLMKEIVDANAPDWFKEWAFFDLQPMRDIHLHSDLKDELEANGDMLYIYIFGIVAFFILIIACINYMNLATARAMNRSKEVGLRKVIGARRKQLLTQFLSESITLSLIAFVVSVIFLELLLPFFNQITGKELALSWFNQPALLLTGLGITIFVGLLAGSYPAVFLAGFQPVKVLKGVLSRHGKGSLVLRKALVVLQFTVSIILIIGMFVIFNQWQFLRNKKLGIQTEQMLMIPFQSQRLIDNYPAFKNKLKQHPSIINVTATSKDPLSVFSSYRSFNLEGEDNRITLPYVAVDRDFFDTYEAEVIAGRGFIDYKIDSASTIILNESAVELIGLENPVGQRVIFSDDYQPTIVGVVKDFHFESLHSKIRPMYFYHSRNNYDVLCVRIRPENVDQTLALLQNTWKEFQLDEALSYSFLDESINQRYQSEERFMKIFSIAAALAIFIACLGIIGLAAFSANQRRKEIGIRKVLGATVGQIAVLLSKDFILLVGLAFLIAIPIAYWSMSQWLANFAYQVALSPIQFIAAGMMAILIAWLAVGYQSVRAGLVNPVHSLKYE